MSLSEVEDSCITHFHIPQKMLLKILAKGIYCLFLDQDKTEIGSWGEEAQALNFSTWRLRQR